MADKSKRGLGSGLSAIFGDDYAATQDKDVVSLPISKVEPRAEQPRTNFDDAALEELAASITQYGLIQPITVRRLDSGFYQIIAGERRWRASRLAGLKEVPVRVIEADDKKATELALVENLQREDLNPIEEAFGYKTLMEEYSMTQEEAALAVGKSRPSVANALRLLGLCGEVLGMVADGSLSSGHARALLGLKDAKLQHEAAIRIINDQLSVRQTEALVKRLLIDKNRPQKLDIEIDYVREVEKSLENALGRKVKLHDGKKIGKLEIEFYGSNDREQLINNLMLFSKMRSK